ncbi:AraC family ligand binding domain-containing protein [Photobacterium sp. TY1-4]|uniref:AraC family ligand binding domain-containing protein n=1 Tax=Photobacterium sp. TY1-4 TaxID=2899122 RepID=UPI0021C078AB|nr:AraC family ligand binding domain-containing protein [Photobacterium sp. TY1-4]UXI04088.1 AraC family ligand binding domain-containing protein [Photobacterium sp. TY1-4]
MKQAIEFSHTLQQFLHVGSRRKSHISYMIVVREGAALFRLGHQEFLVPKGQGFWIPFNCLHALTVLPGTRYDTISFSSRLTIPLCREAGFFTVSPLLRALLDELQCHQGHSTTLTQAESVEKNLLNVIADQVTTLQVRTEEICPGLNPAQAAQLAQLFKGEKITPTAMLEALPTYLGCTVNEFEACLTMREALRLTRSGRKLEEIAQTLQTSHQALNALALPILGHHFE